MNNSLTDYEKEIRESIIVRNGSCDAWLSPQIRKTAQVWWTVDLLFDQLQKNSETLFSIETGSMGQMKMTANPVIQAYQKASDQLDNCFTLLGLNYGARATNVKESTSATMNEDVDQGLGGIAKKRTKTLKKLGNG